MRVFDSLDEVAAAVGEDLGSSEWLVIEQDRIDAFADATGDHQWIHVDVERAAAGPFGRTVAHGYLTLALLPMLGREVFRIETPTTVVNYGLNKVRFPAPVPVGGRVRSHVSVAGVVNLPTGKQLTLTHTIELEGSAKPACIAETVVLLLAR